MTQIGVLLGTAAYMSPEQAKGRPADKRSDVWAFGCVFYEMLTGQRAFAEDDISETLAAVLKSEPDWTRIPSDVPPGDSYADSAMPRQRSTAARRGHLRSDVRSARARQSWDTAGNGERRRRASFALAARAAAACRCGRDWPRSSALARGCCDPVPRAPIVAQFSFALPEGQVLSGGARQSVAISPDGTRIVYAANSRLFLRSIGELVAHPIPGTEGTDSRRRESAVFTGWSVDRIFLHR